MTRTIRDRLLDDLRFGPMAHYMLGWSAEQRTMLVETLADDLLRSWVLLPLDTDPEDRPAPSSADRDGYQPPDDRDYSAFDYDLDERCEP